MPNIQRLRPAAGGVLHHAPHLHFAAGEALGQHHGETLLAAVDRSREETALNLRTVDIYVHTVVVVGPRMQWVAFEGHDERRPVRHLRSPEGHRRHRSLAQHQPLPIHRKTCTI